MPQTTQNPQKQAKCPRCGSTTVYRSRRRGVIERHLFSAIQLRPYRCENCDNRFFMRRMTQQGAERTQLVTT